MPKTNDILQELKSYLDSTIKNFEDILAEQTSIDLEENRIGQLTALKLVRLKLQGLEDYYE